MAAYNRFIAAGNLTQDPTLNTTNSGISVCNASIAVNDPRSKRDDDVDFFDLVLWRELGETFSRYKKKGDPVLIEGKMKQQRFKDKQGNNRSKHVVVVDNVQFLGSANGNSASQQGSNDNPFDDDDIPF